MNNAIVPDQLKKYQTKAAAIINDILSGCDFSEKEIMILAAAMQISEFKQGCDICNELDDVEMYLGKYHDSGDSDYLEFAKDEFKHAQKPLALLKLRLHYASPEEIVLYNKSIERVRKLELALVQ